MWDITIMRGIKIQVDQGQAHAISIFCSPLECGLLPLCKGLKTKSTKEKHQSIVMRQGQR